MPAPRPTPHPAPRSAPGGGPSTVPGAPAPAAPGAEQLAGLVFEAVLFDLDGTLVDSTPAVERSWRRWAREWGLADGFVVTHGVPARQILAKLVPAHDVERAFADIERIEVADVAGVRVLPGAVEALRALPPSRVAIATSGTAPLARARIAATGLPAPQVVVTADDVAVGKPDPAPYLLAARRLGADPARCLVVEDAPAGLASGRAAGCRTVALLTTHGAGELLALQPDALVADLSTLRFSADPDGVRVTSPR